MQITDKIAILGYGTEGMAMNEYLRKHGFKDITICDQKEKLEDANGKPFVPWKTNEKTPKVKLRLGKNYLKNLSDFDVVFRSPGIKYLDPEIQKAKKAGVEISSATKLFFEKCPCKIIGVTGTKGKGTTASLIAKILENGGGGKKNCVFLGGNIGVPATTFLDKLNKNSIVVLELSSFQMQDLNMSPHISVVLNTTSDHMDYHKNVAEYLKAKEAIVKYQKAGDYAIFNKDYPYSKRYAKLTKAKKIFISAKDVKKKFGDIKIALPGPHNLENIAPAVAVCEILKVPKTRMKKIIEKWRGLEHRLEFVEEINGVKYYNDSFSTNPPSTIAAIKSFPENNMILIAGGSEKFSDFTELGKEIVAQKNLKVVILIGQMADRIEEAILKAEKKYAGKSARILLLIRRDNFDDAVFEAYIRAKAGWVVAMSPAAASFDMFRNYKERGKRFKEIVRSFRQ